MTKEEKLRREEDVRQEINFLFNNWCHNSELRDAFEAIFQKLSSGTKTDNANAEKLREYLSYPGSPSARSSAESLLASINEPEGRKAAGLVRKGRGKKNDPAAVKMKDEVMQFIIAFRLGRVKKWEVDAALLKHCGESADPATIRKFRKALEARAHPFADGYIKFQEAFASKKPLWGDPGSPVKSENNR